MSASNLTLALAVERLPSTLTPIADPPDLAGFDAAAEIRKYINRANEYFHTTGSWAGLEVQALITPYVDSVGNYTITLPRHLETCIRGGVPGYKTWPTRSEWYQFLPNGGGMRSLTDRNYGNAPEDMGAGYCTFRDILTATTLTVSSDQTEIASKYIWLRGLDAAGNKIFSTVGGANVEGVRVTLSATPATTSQHFSAITSVSKDISVGNITVTDGTNTLAVYEPGERSISYRRYLVQTADVFKGMFKRKFCWAYSDNDPIFPDCMPALEMGIRALRATDELDSARGAGLMAEAVKRLDDALASYLAGTEGTLQPSTYQTSGLHNMT